MQTFTHAINGNIKNISISLLEDGTSIIKIDYEESVIGSTYINTPSYRYKKSNNIEREKA